MGLNRKSAKKLASLSALGAGAMALTAGPAEASVIYSGPIDLKVGFDCSCGGGGYDPYVFGSLTGPNLIGPAAFLFHVASSGTPYRAWVSGIGYGSRVFPNTASTGLSSSTTPWRFQSEPSPFSAGPSQFLRLFPAGAVWPGAGSTGTHLPVIQRSFTYTGSTGTAATSFNNFPDPLDPAKKYLLFSFDDPGCGAGQTCYGWMEVALAFVPRGPNVDILGWGYEDTGSFIAAGDTGVPEPSTFALTGLAALALGAKGLRRWRAARAA